MRASIASLGLVQFVFAGVAFVGQSVAPTEDVSLPLIMLYEVASVPPRAIWEAHREYGLRHIEMWERAPSIPGYHYRLTFGDNAYIIMGSTDSALEVYWNAASATLKMMRRTL